MKARLFFGALCMFVLSGCSLSLGEGDVKSFYVLDDAKGNVDASSDGKHQIFQKLPLSIVIRDTTSGQFLSGQRIVFSSDASSRGYYQYSYWVEPPAKRFSLLLQRRLENCGMFKSVVRRSSSTVGDVQLNTDLIEFYHDIEEEPGSVKISINVELVDLKTFAILGQKEFSLSVPVKSYNIDGAVEGFGVAVSKILDEVTTWSYENLAKKDI